MYSKTLPEMDQASTERVAAVSRLRAGARIHVSGICGTGMAAVASLLKQRGFYVSGSDKAFYPPMGDVVRSIADEIFEGYSAQNLASRPELVVIGNSLSRGNAEVEFVLEQGVPYASMPEVFSALLIGGRDYCATSVVVCGTHGKTTTTSLVANLFEHAQWHPGYFIGGVAKNFQTTVRVVDERQPLERRLVVLEGDEYDSAFYAKWPKFHSYRPDIVIMTSLEFDHADIYESVEQIETEFIRLAQRVPAAGAILYCDADERLRAIFSKKTEHGILCQLYSYGEATESVFRLVRRSPLGTSGAGQILELNLRGTIAKVSTKLSGEHNALNMLAAAAVGEIKGLAVEQIEGGLASFEGVLRRQTVVPSGGGIVLIEDFAHHPTAVDVTLRGLKESFPDSRLIAVFEPRSNTSRRAVFQDAYTKAFAAADVVIIQESSAAGVYSNTSGEIAALDVKRIVNHLRSGGKGAYTFGAVAEIKNFILQLTRPGDVVVVMSNGDFGGLIRELSTALSGRQAV